MYFRYHKLGIIGPSYIGSSCDLFECSPPPSQDVERSRFGVRSKRKRQNTVENGSIRIKPFVDAFFVMGEVTGPDKAATPMRYDP